ncbi:MAG: elongation factor G [Candidatus Edwardsbacteria bacterium]
MQEYKIENLRNVALVAHGSAGKTTLAEAILFNTKNTERLGRIEEGNTVMDFDADEIARKISISTSLAWCNWQGKKINLLDTPGYADFAGEVKAGLRAVDSVIVVVQAVAGVEVGTEKVWKYAEDLSLPRMVFISRLQKEHADFYRTLTMLQEIFGRSLVSLTLPIGEYTGFKGVINLIRMKAIVYDSEGKGREEEIPANLLPKAKGYQEKMVESAAECDDELMTKYLDGATLSEEEILRGLHLGTITGKVAPVLCGDGYSNMGIDLLLENIVTLLPSPVERGLVLGKKPGLEEEITRQVSTQEPTSALVFKTLIEPHAGSLTYFRVFSGLIEAGTEIYNATKEKSEKIGQLFFGRGKDRTDVPKVMAGDIGIAVKLKDTSTGDTLCSKTAPILFPPLDLPKPTISMAIETKSKEDEGKVAVGLARLHEEDPTFSFGYQPEIKQTLISGLGELHLDVMMTRMKRKYGGEVNAFKPRIAYRETITKKVEAEYKHKKQTGGHGQFGHVFLRLEPLPRGNGFEFVDEIVGGVIPSNYIPAVEKGTKAAMAEGVLAGYPIADIRVALFFGSYHPVDSSGTSFEIAGAQALKKGVLEGSPVLLEPIMKVEVMVPEEFAGQVMGDLNARRGRIQGMDSHQSSQIVKALVPQAEMYKYSTSLRSMTQGTGSFEMGFSHYEEVPYELTQKIIAEAKKEKEEKK